MLRVLICHDKESVISCVYILYMCTMLRGLICQAVYYFMCLYMCGLC